MCIRGRKNSDYAVFCAIPIVAVKASPVMYDSRPKKEGKSKVQAGAHSATITVSHGTNTTRTRNQLIIVERLNRCTRGG